jgi:hypothetical protein
MSWDAVRAWRDRLTHDVAHAPPGALSPEGAQRAVRAALASLTDEALTTAATTPGDPWQRACFVAARTVCTAPIEWCALLLGRGSEVLLKAPADDPGLAPWLVEHAQAVGLPLRWTTERSATQGHDVVLVMGSDATVASVRAELPASCGFFGFGARFSLGWWGRLAAPTATAAAFAHDLALHDTRGCMSPSIVFTDANLDLVVSALASALQALQVACPRGACSDIEHAEIRARGALARVLGRCVEGEGWAVHALPITHARPAALPRCAQVVEVRDINEALHWARAWSLQLSTVATTDEQTAPLWSQLGASRVCPPGQMQSPPLLRAHDGVHLLHATARATSGAPR